MGGYLRPNYDVAACYPKSKDKKFGQKKTSVDTILKLSRRHAARGWNRVLLKDVVLKADKNPPAA